MKRVHAFLAICAVLVLLAGGIAMAGSMEKSMTGSKTESMQKPMTESMDKPMTESMDKPMTKSMEKPMTEPMTDSMTESAKTPMTKAMPGPNAEALWTYITQDSPYSQWGYWPDHMGMQKGRAPHGPKHKVFVNKAGLDSMMTPVAYGTIEVKENYSEDEKLTAITVMYKVKDYNPENGDWYWAKYTPEGKPGPAGKPAGCISCHATQAANDFILVHTF